VPEAIANGVWDRKRWTDTERKEDGKKVPSGAAKVSMGGALDKFHKDSAKGLKQAKAASALLAKTATDYADQIAKKYPKLSKRIKARLIGYELAEFDKNLNSAAARVREYPEAHKKAVNEMQRVGAEFIQWEKAGATGSFKPTNGKAAEKALVEFINPLRAASYATDKVKKAVGDRYDHVVQGIDAGWTKQKIEWVIDTLSHLPAKP